MDVVIDDSYILGRLGGLLCRDSLGGVSSVPPLRRGAPVVGAASWTGMAWGEDVSGPPESKGRSCLCHSSGKGRDFIDVRSTVLCCNYLFVYLISCECAVCLNLLLKLTLVMKPLATRVRTHNQ